MARSYPRTRFDIVDQTTIQEIQQNAVASSIPMAIAAYTSDIGSEEWKVFTSLKDFCDETGSINFIKHGQAQLTVAEELRAGAAVLCKRMVSENATLANITIRARVVDDAAVKNVYLYQVSQANAKTLDDASSTDYEITGDKASYAIDVPLFTVTAAGRGAAHLSFDVIAMYSTSKDQQYLRYNMRVYNNNELVETIPFTMNPDIVINDISQSMEYKINTTSKYVRVTQHQDGLYKLLFDLLPSLGVDNITDLAGASTIDIFNGKDVKGNALTAVRTYDSLPSSSWVTGKPADLADKIIKNMAYAKIVLENGSYGEMGNTPIANAAEYERMLLATFGVTTDSELFDPVIYDTDMYKIDFICDCAYPVSVKKAITNVVEFRGDMVFLADLGLDISSMQSIKEVISDMPKSRCVALYHNTVGVYNPYTKKQIKVTLPYLLASRIINHISNGASRPFAGLLNNIVFNEIINGTINFIPVEIPGVNQKQELADMCVNYISIYDGVPVMDTMFSSQQDYTDFSYISNTMAVQEVIKAIRTRCPKTRYTFMSGNDYKRYLDDINTLINQYSSNFDSIEATYANDEAYAANNIFYAVLKVRFKNFVQEEYFKIVAIN